MRRTPRSTFSLTPVEQTHSSRRSPLIKRIILVILFVLAYTGSAAVVMLMLPPGLGLVWMIGVVAAFLWWHLRDGSGMADRQALVRLHRPVGPWRPILIASAATVLATLGMSGFIEILAPPLSEADLGFLKTFMEYQGTRAGYLAVVTFVVLLAPVVEEFSFRGRIQHSLEQRISPVWAILVSTSLFSGMHIGVPHWSIHSISFALGLGAGAAAFLFRSIWVPVGIHASWNGLMVTLPLIHGSSISTFGDMTHGLILTISVILIGAGFGGWYVVLAGRQRPSSGSRSMTGSPGSFGSSGSSGSFGLSGSSGSFGSSVSFGLSGTSGTSGTTDASDGSDATDATDILQRPPDPALTKDS